MPQPGSLFILLFHLSAFSEAVSLARLVKAEIVSPYSRIDENPVIMGHDLCFDKTCQGNRIAKRAEVER